MRPALQGGESSRVGLSVGYTVTCLGLAHPLSERPRASGSKPVGFPVGLTPPRSPQASGQLSHASGRHMHTPPLQQDEMTGTGLLPPCRASPETPRSPSTQSWPRTTAEHTAAPSEPAWRGEEGRGLLRQQGCCTATNPLARVGIPGGDLGRPPQTRLCHLRGPPPLGQARTCPVTRFHRVITGAPRATLVIAF